MPNDPKVSLIISTLGRREPLGRCLETIRQQNTPPHQVIVVDQNEPGWLSSTLAPFQAPVLPLIVVTSLRGLSLGRNQGALQADGDILGFPDDDCWYPSTLVQQVATWFRQQTAASILSTRIVDETGKSVIQPWPEKTIPLKPNTIWRSCSAAGMFVRRDAFAAVGGFDLELGVGASSGMEGCEETDLGLRLLAGGYSGHFEPTIAILHADDPPKSTAGMEIRALRYGRGIGWALAKNRLSPVTRARFFIRPIGGIVVATLKGDAATARYHRYALRGRWEGWKKYRERARA